MKLSVFMLLLSIGIATSTLCYGQSTPLSIHADNQTVQQVLDEIEQQSGYSFFYNNKQIDTNRKVTLRGRYAAVFDLLNKLFAGTDVIYTVLDKNIILKVKQKSTTVFSPQPARRITGVVVDNRNQSVAGATILVKGSTNGVITDMNGNFEIEVAPKDRIEVSFIGFLKQEIPVEVQAVYTIILLEDTHNLEEVVVTALGIKREEKALGYAVQKISGSSLTTVKTVDLATSLTGRVAGMDVKNSTEFNSAPSVTIRGYSPLLVIDGVPYHNMTMRDVSSDDIKSVDVLKGATASALYGARGGSGAIMITTKRGSIEGLNVSVNSSTMFNAGYLRKPEVQTSYSSGAGGRYAAGDYVWGDKLNIGRTARQYNPYTYTWEERPLVSLGKDNLKNFSQLSLITNNNINVAQKGKYGSIRTSLTHVYNKGQYPNTKLNKITYAVAGDINWRNFSFEGGVTYNKRFFPNDIGSGYGGSGFLYNLLVWSGAEYDIRDYRNYWVKKNEKQNWMDDVWYDNPYFIANEITQSSDYDVLNGFIFADYKIVPWLKFSFRSGLDSYSEKKDWKNPVSAVNGWDKKGYYGVKRLGGYSLNNDVMLMADYHKGDFNIDGLVGSTIYYYHDDNILSETQNGLIIPGYYSLKSSVDPAKTSSSMSKKQTNSLYAKVSASWKSSAFVDFTARNDWSSTLPKETRSYFYPSVATSIVLSEFLPMARCFSFWKVRASWTQTKSDLGVYEINQTYSLYPNSWNGLGTAYYPSTIRNENVKPSTSRSYEVGTAFSMFGNRLNLDLTYYNRLNYNLTRSAGISSASGFSNTLINIGEKQVGRGVEVTLSGDIIKTGRFVWTSIFNWALDRYYYSETDPVYSTQKPWVAAGERWDWYEVYDWERDLSGNIIHENGYPVQSQYPSVAGYSNPDWIWGFSNIIKYRDFTFSFSFDGRAGGVAHSVTDQAMWNSGRHIDSDNQWRYDEVVNGKKNYVGAGVKIVSGGIDRDSNGNILHDDRVFAPNDAAVSYEAYTLNYNPYIGNVRIQNVFDQTFFKLRDLSFSYTLPQPLSARLHAKGLTIGFVGQNVLIWTKEFKYSDPDRAADNLNSPSVRYLGFNIRIDL